MVKLIEELEHSYPTGTHERQDRNHVHFIRETPDHKYVAVTDLGADKIVTYTFGLKDLKNMRYQNSMLKMDRVILNSIIMGNTHMLFMNYLIE